MCALQRSHFIELAKLSNRTYEKKKGVSERERIKKKGMITINMK